MSEKKKIATREGFGKEIVALGKENPDILVVDIDIGKSCKTGDFRKELPQQYLNVGIAEQNGAGLAAGLATCGKVPFVVTYAVFGSLRMCEMIRQEVCYPNLNVKIACSHGGVTPANDGASHQSIEDMGVLRTIPNMTVIMPADYNAARKLVRQAAETYGPMYLRFTRDAVPQIYDEDVEFTIGKAHQIQDGKDVAIIANGDTVCLAIEAAKVLAGKGISSRVLDMHTIKPLDQEAVLAAAKETGCIVTTEEANVLGGLGDGGGNIGDICLRRLTDHAHQTYRCRRGGLRQRDIDGQLRGRGRIVRHCAVTAVVSIGIVHNVRIPCVFRVAQLHQIAVSLRVLRQIEDQLVPVAQRHPIGPGGHVLHVDVVVVAQIDLVPDGHGLRCCAVPLRQQPQHDTPRRQQGQYAAHDPPGRGVPYVSAHFHMLPLQICCGTTYCTIYCRNVQYYSP